MERACIDRQETHPGLHPVGTEHQRSAVPELLATRRDVRCSASAPACPDVAGWPAERPGSTHRASASRLVAMVPRGQGGGGLGANELRMSAIVDTRIAAL